MVKDSVFNERLYQHYREYVEFFNDLEVSKGVAIVLMALPNLTIITDLLLKFERESVFDQLTYMGGSEILRRMINTYSSIAFLITAICLLLIFLPFLIFLCIVLETALKDPSVSCEQGEFRRKYENSVISKASAFIILTYPDFCFPIIISTGIKLQEFDDLFLKVSGVIILIFCMLTLFISEFYTLEIKSKNIHTGLINFPNSLIDKAVVFSVIISINCTSGIPSFAIALSSYLIRVPIALYFRFYRLFLYENHMFSLLACGNLCLGLLLAYISEEHMILMLGTALITVILFRIKTRLFEGRKLSKYEEYKKLKEKEPEINEVEELKAMLWEQGRFTFVFRELIFCSRKKNSHRQQLCLEILKSKCYRMESQIRGGTKVLSALDVLSYENHIIQLVENAILISDKSISLLTLIQKKDPNIEIFLKQILQLILLIEKSKEKLQNCMKINSEGFQGKYMLKLLFEDLHKNSEFQKGLEEKHREYILSAVQMSYRKKLFNSKTSVVFINALDEVGKVTKVSNNIVDILGYSAHHLIGSSICEIIPHSLRATHTNSILRYIKIYGESQFKKDPYLQFYAYSKDLYLQEVKITYNYIMNYFENFQLSGAFRKIDSNEVVILTDYYGNLNGWTQSASAVFNFEDLAGCEYSLFNIISLFPALPKYMSSTGVCLETLVFKTSKLKNQSLCLMDPKKEYTDENQIWKKQIEAFQMIIQIQEIVEIYLINLIVQTLDFCQGTVKVRKIIIENPKKVENIDQIVSKLLKIGSDLNANEDDGAGTQQIRSYEKEEDDADFSVIDSEQNIGIIPPDFNFTLSYHYKSTINSQDIVIAREEDGQNFVTLMDFTSIKTQKQVDDLEFAEPENYKYIHESIFNPKIERKPNYVCIIVFLTIVFISLVIYDITSLDAAQKMMEKECKEVKKRNRSLMIYAKSVFNPNASYISEFNNARLFDHQARLLKHNFTYITAYGDPIPENKYYMFNVQIPSTLDRVVYITDPELHVLFTKELEYNFYKVIQAYQQNCQQATENWRETIAHIQTASTARISIIAFGSVIYFLFLIFLFHQFSKQRKMMEAFFKFEKIDLETKISKIHCIVEELENKISEWHFQKYYFDFIKNNELPFLKIADVLQSCGKSLSQAQPEAKAKNQKKRGANNKKPQELEKQTSPALVLKLVTFLLSQIVFLALYGSLASLLLNDLKSIPSEMNDACKLTVYPNIQLASLIYQAPEDVLLNYSGKINSFLEKPTERLPQLFPLLEEAPCKQCKFWNAVMRTNFRSFYSAFEQFIIEKKKLGEKDNLSDAFYSVDVVTERVLSALQISDMPTTQMTIILYLFSLVVFYVLIYLQIGKMNNENDKLEVFLKYFNEETVQKNKHMSAVLKKNL